MTVTEKELESFYRYALKTLKTEGAFSIRELVERWEAPFKRPRTPEEYAETVAEIRAKYRKLIVEKLDQPGKEFPSGHSGKKTSSPK